MGAGILPAGQAIGATLFSIFPAAVWAAHRLQHPTAADFGDVGVTWAVSVGLHFLLGTTAIGILYWLSRNRWYMALIFWLLGAPLLFYTLYLAVKHCATGKVTWRGTSYSNSSAASVGAATSVK